jgi:hypothetical protein
MELHRTTMCVCNQHQEKHKVVHLRLRLKMLVMHHLDSILQMRNESATLCGYSNQPFHMNLVQIRKTPMTITPIFLSLRGFKGGSAGDVGSHFHRVQSVHRPWSLRQGFLLKLIGSMAGFGIGEAAISTTPHLSCGTEDCHQYKARPQSMFLGLTSLLDEMRRGKSLCSSFVPQ